MLLVPGGLSVSAFSPPIAAASAIAVGGAIVGSKGIVIGGGAAIALALVASIVWLGDSEPASDRERKPLRERSSIAASAEPSERREPTEAAAEAEPRVEKIDPAAPVSPNAPGPNECALVVSVVWEETGEAASAIPVSVLCFDAIPYWQDRVAVTGVDGVARFDALVPGSLYVETYSTSHRVDVAPGETKAHEIAMPRGIDVRCRVVDGMAREIVGAEVWLSNYGNHTRGVVVGRTDAAGGLFVRGVGESLNLAARARGFAPSNQLDVRGLVGSTQDVVLVLPGPGGAIEGFVRDAANAPVPGAEILLGRERSHQVRDIQSGQWGPGPPPVRLATDSAGRFSFDGLAPGPISVAVRARGLAPADASATVVAGESCRIEVALGPEARVAGTVRDADGTPLAGIPVMCDRYGEFLWVRSTSGSDGSFDLRGLAPGRREVRAVGEDRGDARASLDLVAGAETRWDPVLAAGPSVAGIVLDERGRPLEGWLVVAKETEQFGGWTNGRTDTDGRFRLRNCSKKPFVLHVDSPENAGLDPVAILDDFAPGDEDIVIRVRDADVPTAFVEGTLVAAGGARLPVVTVACRSIHSNSWRDALPDSSGRFRLGPYRPGEYVLTIGAEGAGMLPPAPLRLEPNATLDLGTLVLEAPGRVRVTYVLPAGESARGRFGANLLAGSRIVESLEFDGLVGESGPLARGEYRVRTRCGDFRAPDHVVEVLPGETNEVEIPLEPAARRSIECRVPVADRWAKAIVEVRDAAGDVVFEYELKRRSDSKQVSLIASGLTLGNYTVQARTDTGLAASATFVVAELGGVAETISLDLE
jgi:hypothetical protein